MICRKRMSCLVVMGTTHYQSLWWSGEAEYKREGGESKKYHLSHLCSYSGTWRVLTTHQAVLPFSETLCDRDPKGPEVDHVFLAGMCCLWPHSCEQQKSLRKREPDKQKTLPLWRKEKYSRLNHKFQMDVWNISAIRYSVFISTGGNHLEKQR